MDVKSLLGDPLSLVLLLQLVCQFCWLMRNMVLAWSSELDDLFAQYGSLRASEWVGLIGTISWISINVCCILKVLDTKKFNGAAIYTYQIWVAFWYFLGACIAHDAASQVGQSSVSAGNSWELVAYLFWMITGGVSYAGLNRTEIPLLKKEWMHLALQLPWASFVLIGALCVSWSDFGSLSFFGVGPTNWNASKGWLAFAAIGWLVANLVGILFYLRQGKEENDEENNNNASQKSPQVPPSTYAVHDDDAYPVAVQEADEPKRGPPMAEVSDCVNPSAPEGVTEDAGLYAPQ